MTERTLTDIDGRIYLFSSSSALTERSSRKHYIFPYDQTYRSRFFGSSHRNFLTIFRISPPSINCNYFQDWDFLSHLSYHYLFAFLSQLLAHFLAIFLAIFRRNFNSTFLQFIARAFSKSWIPMSQSPKKAVRSESAINCGSGRSHLIARAKMCVGNLNLYNINIRL